MSGVRLLVGTRKGGFVLTSDGKRQRWDVSGPHFAGWEVYHLKGSPADPNRLYASQTSGWFGQIIQRSNDGERPGSPWATSSRTRARPVPTSGTTARPIHGSSSASGTSSRRSQIPTRCTRESRTPRSSRRRMPGRRGRSCPGFARTRRAAPGRLVQAGCVCTRFSWTRAGPSGSSSPYRQPACSGPTTAATTWQAINSGLKSEGIPNPNAEAGHCVHRIAMHPSRPNVLFMQKHWDVMRSDNGGDSWEEVSGNLPSDFGFPIDVHAHEPETIYVVPIKSDSEHFPPEGKLRVYRSRTGGNEWEALTNGLPQRDCYVNVLRDAMAVDTLDSCGDLFRYHRRAGVRVDRRGRHLVCDRPRSAARAVGRSADAAAVARRMMGR